jgi:hypothetical protein
MSSANEASYRKIHYLLRPAKNVQRKMLCEAFQKLGREKTLREYRYVGFGSMYYGDFILFHKHLGFQHMSSIEHEKGAERAEYNKPYNCVVVLAGKANSKLAEINWKERPAIVWLDYDYGLEKEVLHDVAQVAANVVSNSILIVTLDATEKAAADLRDEEDVEYDFDVETFNKAPLISQLNLKCGTELSEETDLRNDGLATHYRKLINERIAGTVNSTRTDLPKLQYHQLFNFRYSDGRQMMTVGGIFSPLDADGKSNISHFGFKDLDFVQLDDASFEIEAPKLTLREIRDLNRALPCADLRTIPVPIPDGDKQLYERIYRYFPTFTEAEL